MKGREYFLEKVVFNPPCMPLAPQRAGGAPYDDEGDHLALRRRFHSPPQSLKHDMDIAKISISPSVDRFSNAPVTTLPPVF